MRRKKKHTQPNSINLINDTEPGCVEEHKTQISYVLKCSMSWIVREFKNHTHNLSWTLRSLKSNILCLLHFFHTVWLQKHKCTESMTLKLSIVTSTYADMK